MDQTHRPPLNDRRTDNKPSMPMYLPASLQRPPERKTGPARRRRRTNRRALAVIGVTIAVFAAACGNNFDRNPEAAEASTTSRRTTTTRSATSTTRNTSSTTRPASTTSLGSTTSGGSTTSRTGTSTSSTSSTAPTTTVLVPATPPSFGNPNSLPNLPGRLAIIDSQGRLVVTNPRGQSLQPMANAVDGTISQPTWSPDAARLIWGATSPLGVQIATATVGSGNPAVTLTVPVVPNYFVWTPPRWAAALRTARPPPLPRRPRSTRPSPRCASRRTRAASPPSTWVQPSPNVSSPRGRFCSPCHPTASEPSPMSGLMISRLSTYSPVK